MSDRGPFLPTLESGSTWVLVPVAVLAAACVVADVMLLIRSEVPTVTVTAGLLPVVAAGVTGQALVRQWATQSEARRMAAALGLRFSPRVPVAALAPFERSPLFRVGDPAKRRAEMLVEGEFDGVEILLLLYAYRGRVKTADNLFANTGAMQTVLLVPDAGGVPDFHLAPQDHEWNRVLPGWPVQLDAGEVVQVIAGEEPSVLRGQDAARVGRLTTAACLDDLEPFGGWVIEARDGHLVLYRPGQVLDPAQYHPFLVKAVEMAQAVRRHAGLTRTA